MSQGSGLFSAWKDLLRNSPVLVRMGLSYGTLVVVVAVTLSSASYLFFQQKYDQELEVLHRLLMKNMVEEIQAEVLDVSKTVYMNLSMDVLAPFGTYFSAEDSPEGGAEKLYWTHRQLTELVSRHGPAIEAIHLYYRRSQIFLSSAFGVRYEPDSPETQRGLRWWNLLLDRQAKTYWTFGDGTDAPGTEPETVTVLQGYPLLAEPDNRQVLVAVEFKVAVLKAILDRFTSANTGTTLLVDPNGRLVSASPGPGAWTTGQIQHALALGADRTEAGLVQTVNGAASLVTVVPVPGSDWSLINSTALDHLHRKDGEIFAVLLLISLGVVVFGLGISIPLVFRIYNPLGRLLGRVRRLIGPGAPADPEGRDEYGQLDQALEGLAATLQASKPVIKQEFVLRLLEGRRVDPTELDETLRVLNLGAFPPSSQAASLRLLEGGWVAKYRLLEELERQGGPLVWAAPLPGLDLGLVVEARDPQELREVAQGWVNLARETCGTAVCLGFGRVCASPPELGTSYADARQLVDFRFFYPESDVFLDRGDLLQTNASLAVPETVLQNLAEAIRVRHLPRVAEALGTAVRLVRTPGMSADRGRHELYRVTRVVGTAVSSARVANGEELLRRLEGFLDEAKDVREWESSLLALAADLFAQIEERHDDRNTVLVERVRAYVVAHLAEELSLDKVSAAVSISPSYLSKLFKDVTGVNFVTYVTDVRLLEAQRLLQQSRASIQEIGKLVGFNTPAYFIHQFRTQFGTTPNEYRRNWSRPE